MHVRFFVLTIAWLFLSGCVDRSAPVTEGPDTPVLRTVTLQLNWFPEAEHGGFYAAAVHGFFAEEGLHVELLSGGPNVPVVQLLDSGKVDFAVLNADRVILGRSAQADIMAVMATMQDSPRCIMVHRQSGISDLRDLKNVTLALGNGPTFVEYMTLHLPLENVETVTYAGSIAPFLANQRFAQQAYVFSEPYLAQQQGADPLNLMVSEIGFNPYASLLTTTRQTCNQDSELVAKVVRASVRGWKQYLSDPQKTNELIDQLNPDMNPQALAYGVQQIIRLCRSGGERSPPLGSMTRQRWQTLIDQLVETKLVAPGSVAVEETFSNGFLPSRQAADGEG